MTENLPFWTSISRTGLQSDQLGDRVLSTNYTQSLQILLFKRKSPEISIKWNDFTEMFWIKK